MLFEKNNNFQGYIVSGLIKAGDYAESYRVKDSTGKNYFLKIIDFTKLHPSQLDNKGCLIEEYISKSVSHKNICVYKESGNVFINNVNHIYIVYEYIVGEPLAEKVVRAQQCSVYDTKRYALNILEGLKYLHSQESPIIHNEVTIQNTMLNMTEEPDYAVLIDFGHARILRSGMRLARWDDLNPFYLAPERFNGICTVSTDLYAVGVLMFHLLFGRTPWYFDISRKETDEEIVNEILRRKKIPFELPDTTGFFEFDEHIANIILRATSHNINERFQTASEFIDAINEKIEVVRPKNILISAEHNSQDRNIRKGNGFKDVAGMNELKERLQSDVIDLLNNPEEAKAFGLSIPNGILFYGPPGCGKTFFAEKFAEQAGMNYIYVKCSDVASPYIHGGQQKIAALFDEARAKAPSIIFLDEIDAMIKDRSKHNNVSEAGEVNEFLAQLNNCGKDGILVIGATNKPNELDVAALRSGRLELKYYIPQPDFETRKQIFEINLSKRKTELGIDYDKLASMTENYVSSDIKLIVDQAARKTFRNKDSHITMKVLCETIIATKPTISLEQIRKHEAIRDAFENDGKRPSRPKIGFS